MILVNNAPISAAILDMDGVLWRSNEPLCDLKELFSTFKEMDIKVLMATNNALNTIDRYISKFDSFGVYIEPWQILTSAMAN